MLVTIAVGLSLVTGSVAVPPEAPVTFSTRLENGLTRAHPHGLVVELVQADPDHLTINAQFRRKSGETGVLRIDFWNDDSPGVESEYSVNGVPHVWLRQVEGEEPESWLSPDIEADPALMASYWGAVTDLRIYEAVAGNPLCGGVRWSLKALAWIAGATCCLSGAPAGLCLACYVGANTAHDAADSIDCSKECKPDCPIP